MQVWVHKPMVFKSEQKSIIKNSNRSTPISLCINQGKANSRISNWAWAWELWVSSLISWASSTISQVLASRTRIVSQTSSSITATSTSLLINTSLKVFRNLKHNLRQCIRNTTRLMKHSAKAMQTRLHLSFKRTDLGVNLWCNINLRLHTSRIPMSHPVLR